MVPLLLSLALLLQVPTALRNQTGVVTGVVRSRSGVPVAGVRVAVSPIEEAAADLVFESLGETDSQGRYRLENVSPGRYVVVVDRVTPIYYPGVSGRSQAKAIEVAAGATINADVVLARSRISGRVLDATTNTGRHIETLSLCCSASRSTVASGLLSRTSYDLVTTAVQNDGTFVFASVAPGEYYLRAVDPQIIAMGQALSVTEVDMDGVEVRVSRGVSVDGTVFDNSRNPATGVSARLRPLLDNAAVDLSTNLLASGGGISTVGVSMSFGISTTVPSTLAETKQMLVALAKKPSVNIAANGRFSFENVLPGRYVLEVYSPGASGIEREIDVRSDGLREIRVELPLGKVTGKIVAGDGGPLPKLSGTIRFVAEESGTIRYAYPDERGQFSLLLASGEYRIFTENLGPHIQSVSDGSRDLTTESFIFDGRSKTEIVVNVD